MYLSEYRAKEILAQYGVRIPAGVMARTAAEAEEGAKTLKCQKYVVKAQINAGGRGLAGGIKFAATPSAVRDEAEAMLGKRLVTAQTGPEGEMVEKVYVEAPVDDSNSIYLGLLIDELTARPVLLASSQSGVDFEEEAHADPGILENLPLPDDGDLSKADVAGLLARVGLEGAAAESVRDLIGSVVRAAFETDAMLVEINPLAIVNGNEAVALDVKLIIDDNALYRHPEFEAFALEARLNQQEQIAHDNEINFVRMEGDIGVVVNGAGLGLATNDLITDAGGKPANFMDIRTSATSVQIARGVQMLLDDPGVRAILVNVHGGGMTVCDTVAEGISFACSRTKRRPPIVFRAAGTHADWAKSLIRDRRIPCEIVDDLPDAVGRAVALAKQGGA